jgi:hypothetical protein
MGLHPRIEAMNKRTISYSKLKWKSISTGSVIALLVLSPTSCKKKPTAASANADANAKIAALNTSGSNSFGSGASGNAAWAARRAAGDKNISVGQGNSYAHITYKPEVKMIDKAAIDASLQGIASDGHGALFKNASAEIKALKAGDILMVKGVYAAKILAAQTDGDQTALIIDKAKLTDVVAGGEINLDSPIGFHGPAHASAPAPPSHPFNLIDRIETPVYAQGGIIDANPQHNVTTMAKDALISGWKIDNYSITPGDNQAAFAVRIMKDTMGFRSALAVDGNISNFQFVSDLNFAPGIGTQIVNGVGGMSGQMHVVWEIGKQTPGVWAQEDKIKLPIGAKIPLAPVLDGLPLEIELSAALLIHPALTGGNEYSKGDFTIAWVGSKSSAAQFAQPGNEGLTFTIGDNQSISAVAPLAMVLSLCAPRLELDLSFMGSWGVYGYTADYFLQAGAAAIDLALDAIEKHLLPESMYAALKASPLGSLTATNILNSNADIYVQVISTEGVTHAPNITLAPCTKTQLKITAQSGGDANLLGLTGNAKTAKDLFTKEFIQWNPGSNFCKSV